MPANASPPGSDELATQEFKSVYNVIETALRERSARSGYPKFMDLVHEARDADGITGAEHARLTTFAKLRNLLVHHPDVNGQPLAVPSEETLREMRGLAEQIVNPARLSDLTHQAVVTTEPTATLGTVLERVAIERYSQFPVYGEGRFQGLLTTNMIARWLADRLAAGGSLSADTPVVEVLRFAEERDRAHLVPPGTRVTEAVALLSGDGTHPAPAALVVTAGGKVTERPVLILTAEDLPELSRVRSLGGCPCGRVRTG